MRRWPLQPLLDACGVERSTGGDQEPGGLKDFAKRIGVDNRQLHRWAHDGIPDTAADLITTRLRLMGECVWANWCDTTVPLSALFDQIIWPPPKKPRDPDRMTARDRRIEQFCWRQLCRQLAHT